MTSPDDPMGPAMARAMEISAQQFRLINAADDPGSVTVIYTGHHACGWTGDYRDTEEEAQSDVDHHRAQGCCPMFVGPHIWRAQSATVIEGGYRLEFRCDCGATREEHMNENGAFKQ